MSITREEYYELLKKKHEKTDWNSLESVKEYNEYGRQLRKQMQTEED